MCKTNTGKKIAFLVTVILAVAIFANLAAPAEAAGVPTKVVAFTDKKVYTAWWMSAKTTTPTFNKLDDEGQTILLYAFVLDDDGNIMKNRTVQVTLNDTTFDHFEKGVWTRHSDMVGNNTYFTTTKNLNDTGASGDAISNDGLYTTMVAMPSALTTDVATSPRMDDQIRVKILVKDTGSGLNMTTYVLVSWGKCHQAGTTSHPAHITTTASDTCINCHGGYEHFFESVSNTIPYDYLDVHFKELGDSLPDSTMTVKGMQEYRWNSTQADDPLLDVSWKNDSGGGAVYCLFCHQDPAGSNWFDYGAGDRATLTDRPSCSQSTSGYGGLSCHSTTEIEGTTVIPWSQGGAVSGNDTLAGINNQKAHNHTGNKANVTCTLCHAGPHGLTMPNMSVDISSSGSISDQCLTCHNITGGLNITANGGTNVVHDGKTNCKNCHIDNNKLDTHLVPVGVFGGMWCLNCHNLTGKAPINMKVDPVIVNITNQNYTHSSLNEKSNAANSSRICWACHTNNSYVFNRAVNSTNLSATEHPTGYDTPRNCTSCHYNTSAYNFSAPQNSRHTWYASDMKTTAVTDCPDCHAQDEMVNTWNETVYPPKNGSEEASHYGKNRTSFFLPLVGKVEYCGYCHQNESTVMGPFANPANEVRSDHASQITTPGCGNNTCHKPGRLHDDTLVVPIFNESNINTTCLSCHSNTSYNAHNNTLTCWDCHMGNVSNTSSTWIHPIQFIQYNGNFTGAKLTGATCYDCHKSTSVDNTTQNLSGKKAPKVYNQAHSNDPSNGTKWGDYWKYTPTTYQFASYDILGGNGSIDPLHPFENIMVPSNEYMQLNETRIGSGNGSTVPFNKKEQQINGPPVPNWTSSTAMSGNTAGSVVNAAQDSTKGNPAGSLKASFTTGSGAGTIYGYVWWNYSFYYNPNSSYGYAFTNASADYNITSDGTYTQTVYLIIVKPSGATATLASNSNASNTGWLNLTNNSFASVFSEDGSVTPYRLQLYTVLSGVKTSKTYTVNYDNILLKFQEKVRNRYELVVNTTGVPVSGNRSIGMSYQVHKENTSLMIYNNTSKAYELVDILDKGVFFDYVKNINSTHYINSANGVTGNVSVKFVDNDQSDADVTTDVMHIRYLYIYTDRGLQYPCEQCHSPNKHYLNPAIGSPDKFKGNNKYNTTDMQNSTWCQQCHWQGASNYSDMVKEYNVTRNPPENIPPEITGNTTYAPLGKPGYVNHTGSSYSNMNDSGCFSCHGKSGDTTTSQFVHNVQIGASGNRQCITCHNTSASNTKYKKVDVDALRKGMHANLKNASANVSNASNPIELACWACHGDGLYNNSDDHHPGVKTCDKCHTNTTGKLNYSNATRVYEHIPPGFIIPEANITADSTPLWSCADCHNNSINTTALINDNEADPINARTGHYGLNRTGGKLMYSNTSSKGNSEDCTYCHNGNSANMTKWGINTSTTKNLSNKASHSSYTNNQCGGCHNYTDSSTFTFHAEEINQGAGSGPDCKSCHNISAGGTDKGHIDYPAFNTSIHGGINTTAGADENEGCWACHGNGNSEGHNTTGDASAKGKYTNPYVCADCHVSTGVRYAWATGKGALNVSEHFTNGTKIKASYNATATFSCLKCHQDIGEMRLNNSDNDYNITAWASGGDNYNATIGGNNSPYHYGVKRTTLNGSAQNTDGYCNYCHSNSSSIFPYLNQHNKSIFEHTASTSADIKNTTSLNCNNPVCHGSGRIHNTTLNKTVQTAWTSGQKDYCAPCHKPKPTGLANKSVYGQWHDPANSSSDNMTNCNYCHDSGSLGSTALSYSLNVHSDNLTYPTGATTCVACHNASSTYVKSRKILTHFPNASKDKGNTSLSGRTCELCHGIAGQSMHASGLVKKPNYGCADCHVSTAAGPYWANQSFNSYIDTTSHDNTSTSNVSNCVWCHNSSNANASFHFTPYANGSIANPGWGSWQSGNLVNCTNCHDSSYNNQAPFYAPAKPHAGTGNNTDECYSCHTNVNTYNAAPLAVHSVVQAPGNANCTKCHDIGGAASKEVDVAAMNRSDSIHLNLNSGASSGNATVPYAADSKRCWACHGDGSDKNEHDQARYKNPYKCEDCHTSGGSQSGKYVSFNVSEHFAGGADIRTANASYCYTCHNKGEMLQGHNDADVSSSNASVGHYGKKRGTDIRNGTSANCTYCHQNSTTGFESAMLKSSNKNIFEHTDAGLKNTTGRGCTNNTCHAQGFIHNATLTKPAVQVWTSGKFDYCAPCHRAGNANATKYVYGHNSSNISVITADCGYCHNASSQGQTSTGALRIHTSTLTNKSTANTTCVTCHQDSTYVTNQRVVYTHYPGAPFGKANTSQDSFTCESCHGNMVANKMHSPVSLPPDRCNNCHNSTTTGSFKATKIPYLDGTRHDNATHNVSNNINCDWCHNNSNAAQKFHFTQYPNGTVQAPGWNGWVNGTNANCTNCHDTYNQTKPFYAEPIWHKGNYGTTPDNCYQCHTNVSSASSSNAPVALHNVTKAIDWSYCNNCHSSNKGGAPIVDNASLASGMHATLDGSTPSNTEPACKACHGGNSSVHKNATANNCTYCHITGSIKYSAKNVSRHIPYPYTTDVNTSRYQNVFCSDCHNNSLGTFNDPTQSNKNATTSHYGMNKTGGKLMYNSSGNTEDCTYCHRNDSNMAAWGILGTSNANLSKKGGSHATAANSNCYTCHVNSTSAPVTFHIEDVSAGTGGGPDCIACHNIGGMAQGKLVNFSVMNDTSAIHKNLNSGASASGVDAENKKCWACHTTNGTAPQAGNHSFVDRYKNPYNCTDCHISKAGQNFNYTPINTLLNVTQHKADTQNGTTIFTPSAGDCYSCHNKSEMMVAANDPDSGTGAVYDGLHGGDDSVSHYGLKRNLGSGDAYCNYCHSNASSMFPFANQHSKSIFEHTANGTADIRNTTTLECLDCHTSDLQSYRIHNSTLKTPSASAWTSGKDDRCVPCHITAGSGSSLKVNNSYHNTTTGSITDCGYCHNGDAMKAGNAPQNIHSDNLTTGGNSTYNNCYNCHQNGFASKVIIEHTNNTGANITNASMTCSKGGCHVSNETHSATLIKPAINNWTTGGNDYCAPCHNSSDSVNNATKKVYNQGHNPANGTNDNITSCGNCHNASTPGAVPASFKLHDSSMTKSPVEPNASTCQGCHNGSSLFVGAGRQIFSHMPNASQYRGNTTTSSYTCEYCHNMTSKPSMHSAGMTRSSGTCETCHLNNTSPFKSTQKNVTQLAGGMLNHSYNGIANTTCKMCHNASGRAKFHLSKYASGDIADPQNSSGYPTFQDRATWDLGLTPPETNDRGILVDCRDCHEKYNDTAPFNAPYFEANRTGVNAQEHVGKGYTLKNCYICHTNETNSVSGDTVVKPAGLHNVSIEPLTGGPNCTKCHNIGSTDSGKAPGSMLVNFTAFNSTFSKHKNLTNATAWGGSGAFGLIDTACWACHQSDGKQMERHPDLKDNTTLTGGSKAYRCADCHTADGVVSISQPALYMNATKVYKHYPGAVLSGQKVHSTNFTAGSCQICHNKSIDAKNNITAGINATVSHYLTKSDLTQTNISNSCEGCHGDSGATWGAPKQLVNVGKHSMTAAC
ncbi:MAG: hypothetical protein WAW23_08525, partial [Candidatus Methanoperedens sp.]